KVNISQLFQEFKTINLFYYFLAVLSLIPVFLVRTLRWKVLIDLVKSDIPLKSVIKIMTIGIFWGIVTPGRLGEFWRAKELTNSSGIPSGVSFFTAFMDRFVDFLVTGTISLIGIIVLYLKFGLAAKWEVSAMAVFLVMFLSFLFSSKIGIQKIFSFFIRFLFPSSIKQKAEDFLSDFNKSFFDVPSKAMVKVLIYGFLYYLFSVFSYYFIALSLNIPVPFWFLFLVVAVLWLTLAIPITVLGFGTREAVFIYFFGILGIGIPYAVAFSILALFLNVLLAVPGAFLYIVKK
ncbi:MAG: lysylphosphatidylglycerol synthase transmembrane domain-containing protein, partial [Candidatus Parcubacteria bacterium]|nr:lysylphosphatidylglycerol synthase transmembrane domain-containing protein [Candidatus Parcubacteria bacterium]